MTSLALLFPGQGSQSAGMLDAFMDQDVVRTTLEEASDALGYDMGRLIAENPDDKLNRTEYTQPALLTASVALLRLWEQRGGPRPAHVLGHSLGEYSALVAAGVFGFPEALALVAFRGKVMNEAVPEGMGSMAAVLGLEDQVVEQLCEQASSPSARVWPANYNCPGQLVVAGHAEAVERVIELARQAGARRALKLAVSVPSHTPLMQKAAEAMIDRLSTVSMREPFYAVWSNAEARPLREVHEIRSALARQLVSPVRWTESIQRLISETAVSVVEMGPGKVLGGLIRRIDRRVPVYSTASRDEFGRALEALKEDVQA